MLLEASNEKQVERQKNTHCGKVIRDHIKACTRSSAEEVYLCGEVCSQTKALYNEACLSNYLIKPFLRKGWN